MQIPSYRPFHPGCGMISPDKTKFLLNIPKNASSFLSNWARNNGWEFVDFFQCDRDKKKVKNVTVILRDPLSRWISGISQYICTYILCPQGPNGPVFPGDTVSKHNRAMRVTQFIEEYNVWTERLLFDGISVFDDHVWFQTTFCSGAPAVPTNYFLLDTNLVDNVAMHLNFELPKNVDENSAKHNRDLKLLQEFFQNRLVERPDLESRIKRHYVFDYDLIKNNIGINYAMA